MPPDRATHLVIAAKQRHELTRAKVIRALRELDRSGTAITFGSVARTAQVSRSWLYTQTDIRDEIRKLRVATPPRSRPALVPVAQRASAESLRQRLAVMQERSTTSSRKTNGYATNSPSLSANNAPARRHQRPDPITLQ
jgi:hypothetical protein